MRKIESKLKDHDLLRQWLGQLDVSNVVVFTNGCFDLLHPGHARFLQAARLLGSALVVGVNDDASVRRLKGNRRPVVNMEDRMTMLASLESVDIVTPMPWLRNVNLMRIINPDIWAKGGDYSRSTLDPEEVAAADALQVEIHIIPFEAGFSTTAILDKISS